MLVCRVPLLLLLLLPLLQSSVTAHSHLSGLYRLYRVLKVHPETSDDVESIIDYAQKYFPSIEVYNPDYVPSVNTESGLQLHVAPQHVSNLRNELNERQVPYSVQTTDLQRDIDEYLWQNAIAYYSHDDWHTNYHEFEKIQEYLRDQSSACGARCSIVNIGQSYEGRPLNVLKITDGSGQPKPKVWIDAGIHAREWISHATAMYLIDRLVNDIDDEVVGEMLARYDWHILPCVNPDGYSYTWDTDRLWRKTRRPHSGSDCVGTDANRNFDFHWASIGVDNNSCSNLYPGPHAFSEPETRAVRDYIQSHAGWHWFITLHSKGQLILAPWGYTDTKPEDYPELQRVGNVMKGSINATHGMEYRFGTSAEILYKSSGTSRDWAKGVPKIKYVYTIELRDKGEHGWLLPPDQILPTGQEIWNAVRAAVTAV